MNFNVIFEPYTDNNYLIGNCNSITFINTSTSINVTVNGFVLTPQAQLTIDGLPGEIDTTKYQFVFASAGGSLMVLRKIYNK